MEIKKLDYDEYAGRKFKLTYVTKSYLDIVRKGSGFELCRVYFEKETEYSFEDCFFNSWLESPIAYGAFDGDELIGYVEGSLESWNNRYRISNICVFDSKMRKQGVGTLLMEHILKEAKNSGARMAVLETQTCNQNAISFYCKHGFEIIGFDMYAYSNDDPRKHEMRIEMGKFI